MHVDSIHTCQRMQGKVTGSIGCPVFEVFEPYFMGQKSLRWQQVKLETRNQKQNGWPCELCELCMWKSIMAS